MELNFLNGSIGFSHPRSPQMIQVTQNEINSPFNQKSIGVIKPQHVVQHTKPKAHTHDKGSSKAKDDFSSTDSESSKTDKQLQAKKEKNLP